MKLISTALALALLGALGPVSAQTASSDAAVPLTRERVKMDRTEFMRTHHYDVVTDTWTLRPGFDSPMGMRTRAEVRTERDAYMRLHRYGSTSDAWIPLGNSPRNTSTMTRGQMEAETQAFMRTHRWDDLDNAWVEVKPRKK